MINILKQSAIPSCASLLATGLLMFGLLWPATGFAQTDTIPSLPFEQYPVHKEYKGKHARVILDSAEKRLYRTRLSYTETQPVNFAGEYVLALWGCGTSCIHGAAVNARTGEMVFLPGTVCCWDNGGKRLTFRLDSRFIMLAGLINESGEYGAHFYEFTGKTFRYIKTIPIKKPDWNCDGAEEEVKTE